MELSGDTRQLHLPHPAFPADISLFILTQRTRNPPSPVPSSHDATTTAPPPTACPLLQHDPQQPPRLYHHRLAPTTTTSFLRLYPCTTQRTSALQGMDLVERQRAPESQRRELRAAAGARQGSLHPRQQRDADVVCRCAQRGAASIHLLPCPALSSWEKNTPCHPTFRTNGCEQSIPQTRQYYQNIVLGLGNGRDVAWREEWEVLSLQERGAEMMGSPAQGAKGKEREKAKAKKRVGYA